MKPNNKTKKFTPEHIAQASQVNLSQLKGDRNTVFGITIDDTTTVDRDDGIWLLELDNGNFELQISITDVAALIPQNSPIDIEALSRVMTLYHTKPPTPMLPIHISTNTGSLQEGESRLAITVFFEIYHTGKIKQFRIEETIFHSLKAFSYEEVEQILKNPSDNAHDQILLKIQKLAQIFAKNRMGKSGILTEDGYVDEDGNLIKENINTHQLIAELMILTNTTIANVLNEKKVPALYRSQDVGIDDFDQAIREMGHCLVPAIYTVFAQPHVGLALKNYCHFTSPLRRFVDLVNHRIIKALIKEQKTSYSKETLENISNYINSFNRQYKQDKSNYLRKKRKGELKQKYDSITDAEIKNLSNTDFSNLIEYLVFEDKIDKIKNHLQDRVSQLQPKDFYYLWFVSKLNIFFNNQDIDGVSILLVASQIGGIDVSYDLQFDSQKKVYYGFCCLDDLTTTIPARDIKKAKTKQKSALMAIEGYINQSLVHKSKINFPFQDADNDASTQLVSQTNDDDVLENIETLTDKQFSKLLDTLIESNGLTPDILSQIDKRIERLQPKDFYKLWFLAKVNRFFNYDHIDAVSVLLVRSQIDHVKVKYEIHKDIEKSCFVASCYVDGLTVSQPQTDSKKIKAKQKSALAYIQGFVENNLTDKLDLTQNSTNNQETKQNTPSKNQDWVSLLHQLCLHHNIDYPEYVYRKIDSFFSCLVSLNYDGKIIQTEGYGRNKKDAKQLASQLIIIQYSLNHEEN